MPQKPATLKNGGSEVASLRRKLKEAEATLRAIQEGHVDALVVQGPKGKQIFSLRSADQPYRLLVEAMSEAALIVSASGVVLHSNRSFGSFLDLPLKRILGAPLVSFSAPQDRKTLATLLQRGLLGPVHAEMAFMNRRGQRLASKVSVSGMTVEEDPALSVVITDLRVRDENREHVTVRRRLGFLAEAGRLLTGTLDPREMLDLIARLALDGVADWCAIDVRGDNGDLRRATIAHRDPVKAEWATGFLRKFPVLDDGTAAKRAFTTGKSFLFSEATPEDVRERNSNPEVHALVKYLGLASAMVVPMKARHETIGTISLVSTNPAHLYDEADLHMAESLAIRAGLALENSKLYRQAQEAIQSREQFLSIASHELRTPLTTLQIQIQSALRKLRALQETHSVREVVPLVLSASMQSDILVHLIDRLLDLSTIRAGKIKLVLEPLDLAEVVRLVAGRFQAQSVHSGTTIKVRAMSVRGNWDRMRIEQILTNLISNGLKYGAGKPIDVKLEPAGDKVRIAIRDSGVGMDAEFLGRIFKPFEQARVDSRYRGLGLGLYITQQLVLAHGGTIKVESTQGVGTMFTVELPLNSEEPASPADPALGSTQ